MIMWFRKLGKCVLFTAIIFTACDNDEPTPVLSDFDYFPLVVGQYSIFDVTETTIVQNVEQTASYQLKIELTDSFPSGNGAYVYVMTRSTRPSMNNSWTFVETWSARRNSLEAVINEGNIPFVKMPFPTDTDRQWNGNALNTLGGDQSCVVNGASTPCDLYIVSGKSVSFQYESSIGSLTFDDTVIIEQNNNTDLIVAQDIRSEVYARGIGLIYKETIQLNYCTVGSCLGQQFIEQGTRYYQRMKEYGG